MDTAESGMSEMDGSKTLKLEPLSVETGSDLVQEPGKIEGYLLKRRKRPLKGWHRRYFVLEKAMLTYGKSPSELQKGKINGTIDIATAVIATEKEEHRSARRIDIDTEDFVYHLKASSYDEFCDWRKHLQHHQLYKKQQSMHSPTTGTLAQPLSPEAPPHATPTSELTLRAITLERRRQSLRKQYSKARLGGPNASLLGASFGWKSDSLELDKCYKELSDAEESIVSLSNILQELLNIELPPYADGNFEFDEGLSGQKKSKGRKSLKKMRTRKTPSDPQVHDIRTRPNSHPSAIIPGTGLVVEEDAASIRSHTSSISSTRDVDLKNREDFLECANQVHRNLKSALHWLSVQSDRCKQVCDAQYQSHMFGGTLGPSRQMAVMQDAMQKLKAQNEDMRSRLSRIVEEASVTYTPIAAKPDFDLTLPLQHSPLTPQHSEDRISRSESIVEFFDAQEYLASSASSSDEEEEVESSSLASEDDEGAEFEEEDFRDLENGTEEAQQRSQTGRRSQLPAPQPDTSQLSLWNILKKNIGKDLSKISMPVALNEPLSMLQVLCEELEYSELLDKAAEVDDPFKRIVFIAAFAVSSYSSTFTRAGTKPFNPLLGETYECVRDDKGFRFIAEKVSHHPPIIACHCESKNFVYTQDVRIKTKFWGKSMEVIPAGTIHIHIPKYDDHYTLSKVTSCVHNILSGERWVDHYGETTIRSGDISCKLTFTKASFWSSRLHEVTGLVFNQEGRVVHELFGKWNEGLYCGRSASAKCVWRAASMPANHQLYYGFSRFAIELNELDPYTQDSLPPTDSRFRPDQRLLEEGDLKGAELEKQRLEGLQRERRKLREEQGVEYQPRFFRLSREGDKHERWTFKEDYWDVKKDPGFATMKFIELW
ncbi:oxysterol-binding protein-related protein 6-like [Diadema antillarum]|uniref:oxysterol-binding protein-related protein 6-like n=1 Tax=Diadema antillarum TaxID=105358 RepID=UPI003A879AF1